jgi:hypothetical protein
MEIFINLIIITCVITYVQNHSGFMFDFTKWLYKLSHKTPYMGQQLPKLLSCSLCQVHWITLFFCLFSGLGVIYSFGLATAFAILSILVNKIIGVIIRLINKI